jgi:G3E family GTPase
MTAHRDQADNRIPITLLTGFLGSGKTTILNGLLRSPGMADVAVIINEFGAVSIDHDLVAEASGDVVQLANGCLCCAVRSDLVSTLFGLYAERVKGTLAPFRRVVIETSGLADPGPILLTLFADDVVARRFRVDGVLTVVDAVNGLSTLGREMEATKQAAAADRLLLTKLDLAPAKSVTALRQRLSALNPGSDIIAVANGKVDPANLLDLGLGAHAGAGDVERWMGLAHSHQDHDHEHGHEHEHEHHHDAGVVSHSVVLDQPIAWADMIDWINALQEFKGPNLLRIKGLANIADRPDRPLVVHAVQEVFHPPAFLDAWPSKDRRTRLVFILRDIKPAAIDKTLKILRGARSKARAS